MSNINIFSQVVQSVGDFKKFVLKSITESLNNKLFKDLRKTEDFIRDTVIDSIKNQDEYDSLKSGRLRNQFGLADTSVVDQVLNQLDDLIVSIDRPRSNSNTINANFTINMIKEDHASLLSSSGATIQTEKGGKLDWLRWLLLEGGNSVIIGYRYLPKTTPYSRTGEGIMVKGKSAIFRVPPSYIGTIGDNWITRGVDEALPTIESYINTLIQKSL